MEMPKDLWSNKKKLILSSGNGVNKSYRTVKFMFALGYFKIGRAELANGLYSLVSRTQVCFVIYHKK